MSRNTRSRYGDPIAYRSPHDALSRPDQSEREAPLAPGAALIVIVLLSLGLWSAIWWAATEVPWEVALQAPYRD